MSGIRLTLKQPPVLRAELRGVNPGATAGLGAAEIERLPVTHGNQTLPLAEFFAVTAGGPDGEWVLEGDLSRFDRLGWQMNAGRIVVDGPVGDYAAAGMTGGEMRVKGSAGLLAACEMAGGTLVVVGDVGDFAAGALPGSMDGMRGGLLVVHGSAGERLGDRMRRGTALVFGDTGDFAASRMVAGTLAIGGRTGAHLGYGMRRGSVVLAGAEPSVAPTFVPALVEPLVFWQLLARDLATHGGPFAALPTRRIRRHLGDVSAAGMGELIQVL